MKKTGSSAAVLMLLLLALCISALAAGTFSDVPEGAWYAADVEKAVSAGLVNGTTSATYEPDSTLSVIQAVKLAACLRQRYEQGAVTLTNGTEVWYAPYLTYAAENEILTAEETARAATTPNEPITRQWFVEIFYRALPASEYTPINTVPEDVIPDVSTAEDPLGAVYAFYRAGILIGSDESGSFCPDSSIKRSEVAAILTRMTETSARKTLTIFEPEPAETETAALFTAVDLRNRTDPTADGTFYADVTYYGYTYDNVPILAYNSVTWDNFAGTFVDSDGETWRTARLADDFCAEICWLDTGWQEYRVWQWQDLPEGGTYTDTLTYLIYDYLGAYRITALLEMNEAGEITSLIEAGP